MRHETNDQQDDGDHRKGTLRQCRPGLVRGRCQQHDRCCRHRSDARKNERYTNILVPELNYGYPHAAGALAGSSQRLHREDVDMQQTGQTGEHQCGGDHYSSYSPRVG